MTRHPSPAHPAPTGARIVSLWNGKLVVPGGLVQNLVSIRISATGNLEAYENQHATAETVFAKLPDFHHLGALPKGVRAPGAEGDALRRVHGVVPLYSSDLPNAGHRRDLLGYAFLGGSILWLFVMNSAAEGNLPPWPGDPTRQERNAFTELVVGAAVALYDGGSRELALRFALWSRMERYEPYGARMRAVVKERPGMTLWNGTQQVDLHDPAAQIVNAVNSGQSNAAILDLKSALFTGKLNHLRDNRWEGPENVLPLGYRFRREVSPDGVTTIVTGVVEADPTRREVLQELAAMAARGTSWITIGRRAAELRLPIRQPGAKGKTFQALPESSLSRAAKGLLGQENYIELWRSGSMRVRRHASIDGALSIRGVPLTFDEGASRGHVDVVVTWPLPEDGWGVPEETWEKILARLRHERERAQRAKKPSGVAASDIPRRVFSGSPTWRTGEVEFRLSPETPTAYRLRRRDATAGVDDRGRSRGWAKAEGEVVATFLASTLHVSVATALERALLRLADDGTELGTLDALLVVAPGRGHPLEQRREGLLAEAAELEARAASLDDLTVTAHRLGHHAQVETYIESAARDRETAREKRAEAERLVEESEGRTEREEAVPLDLAQPALVAVALGQCPPHAPPALVNAVAALGITESLRVTLSEDGIMGHWRATCRVPLLGDETVALLEIAGEVPNRVQPRGASRDDPARMARHLLVHQRGLDEVAAIYQLKPSTVTLRVESWLRAHGVRAQGLAKDALECPVPETRRAIFAACAGDDGVVADLAPAFVAHIRGTYLGSAGLHGWVPGPMRPQRQLLAALTTTMDGVAIKHDLADALGVSPRAVALIALGWNRRGGIVDRDGHAEMRLRPCPHRDCSGSPGYLAQYLVTPETRGGLICTSCRRTPEAAEVVFPAAYLDAWEGPGTHLGPPLKVATVTASPLLSLNQVARRLGCSPYVVKTKLSPVRCVGRMAFYDPVEVEARRGMVRPPSRRQSTGTYTIPEASRLLGVSTDRLRHVINSGVAVGRRSAHQRAWTYLDEADLEVIREYLARPRQSRSGLLGTGEAARRLGLSGPSLRRAVVRGEIPARRTKGGGYQFEPADVDALVAARVRNASS